MSRPSSRRRQASSDEEDNFVELRPFRNLLAPSHILTTRMNHHQSPKPDHGSGTLDRRNGKAKMEATAGQYGTLPRHSQSTYAKLRTVATFTNMYFTHKEAAAEELNFLRAVENGDIDEVRNILEDYETDGKFSSSEDEDAEKKKEEKSKPNGKKPSPPRLVVRKDSAQQTSPRESPVKETEKAAAAEEKSDKNATVIEMSELERADSAHSERKPSSASKWAVAKRKRPSKVHLPVITTTRATPSSRANHRQQRKEGGEIRRFNKNCRDEWGRSALFIAMLHRDQDMMRLLLSHKVDVDECLYHAIDFGFYDVVELFMDHDPDRKQFITGEDSFYPAGLTPIQLAAHKNDYVMLKILYTHGFRISSDGTPKRMFSRRDKTNVDLPQKTFVTVLERTWDESNNKILYYRALASPAYMIMMLTERKEGDDENDNRDFLENIFQLFRKLKKKANDEPTARSLYIPLAEQVEDFACDLLSEVRSPSDLADLLRFDPPGQPGKTQQKNYLSPMQRGFEVRMKRFVAHDNCQLSLSCIRQGTLFQSENGWKAFLLRFILAVMFPILCLAFAVAPDSKLGMLLRNPMVNLSCHVASEVFFLFLFDIRIFLLTLAQSDCLGQQPNALEWLIFMWIVGRSIDEFKKIRETPLIQNFTNQWRLNDVGTCSLFIAIIALRIAEMALHKPTDTSNLLTYECERENWSKADIVIVTLTEGCLAFVTILIHIRALELLYIDRTFGPLQLSLDKMILDAIRFLLLFVITFCGFALAMTQLYWAYGSARTARIAASYNKTSSQITQKVCEDNDDQGNSSTSVCYPVYSTFEGSLLEQYWTLYGYGWGLEPPAAVKIPNPPKVNLTVIIGSIITIIFHLWAVVIMLNMLIAMMSHSFDRVRDNSEIEWKYHRSGMWMKFIGRGIYPRPPPMNLIPSLWDLRNAYKFLRRSCFSRGSNFPSRSNAKRASDDAGPENMRYRQAVTRITNRYLRRYLLPDFKHDDSEQLSSTNHNKSNSQSRRVRRPSYSQSDISSS